MSQYSFLLNLILILVTEDLGGIGGGEVILKIYCMKISSFLKMSKSLLRLHSEFCQLCRLFPTSISFIYTLT